jgi:hypothetical protein
LDAGHCAVLAWGTAEHFRGVRIVSETNSNCHGGRGDEGSPTHTHAAELFACGISATEIGERLGVHERTVRRWLSEPASQALIAEIRSAAVSAISGKTTGLAEKAAIRLGELLASKNDGIALGAAKAIIDTMLRLRQEQEYIGRLAALEEQLRHV